MEKTWKELFANPEGSDVTIVCGNATFPCHKFVLSVASPVLKAMFSHAAMKENVDNIVKIEDFSEDVVETFLKMCY